MIVAHIEDPGALRLHLVGTGSDSPKLLVNVMMKASAAMTPMNMATARSWLNQGPAIRG
jgi:hypothetical protein